MGLDADQVTYERRGAAAVVTIDRQERRNAIDGKTADMLEAAFVRFESDPEALALVLTGAGDRAFCSGADLKVVETLAPRLESSGGPLGFTRRAASKPTIAAISGWCLAGGLELALWCDLRIASADAQFGFTERRFGVPLIDGGTQRMPRIVGLGRALDLILTGRIFGADEALSIGMLTEVVAPGTSPLTRATELANALAALPQETMLVDRDAVIGSFDQPLAEGIRLEARNGPATYPSAAEGAARFASGEGRGGVGAGA